MDYSKNILHLNVISQITIFNESFLGCKSSQPQPLVSSVLPGQKGSLRLVLESSRAVLPARMIRSDQDRAGPCRDLMGLRRSRALSRFLFTFQSFPGGNLKLTLFISYFQLELIYQPYSGSIAATQIVCAPVCRDALPSQSGHQSNPSLAEIRLHLQISSRSEYLSIPES